MKSPDEIKKGLEYLATRDPAKKAELWETGIAYDWQEDAAGDALAYIQQLEARVPRWIPVEERLPEDGKNVLIFVSTMSSWWHMEVDWRTGNSWHNNAETDWNKITHWMPLPEPPEVEHETVHDCNS